VDEYVGRESYAQEVPYDDEQPEQYYLESPPPE
jgi:hypothetical protein